MAKTKMNINIFNIVLMLGGIVAIMIFAIPLMPLVVLGILAWVAMK